MQSYQKDKTYSFVVTDAVNPSGCQIVLDTNGVRHLLTGTKRRYSPGKTLRLTVRGYSHTPSIITGCHYLVLSPQSATGNPQKKEPFSGQYLIPRKKKMDGFDESFLMGEYDIGKRYLFVVVEGNDHQGRQFVEDSFGIKHILSGTKTQYQPGENVRCTVTEISTRQHEATGNYYMTVSYPRTANRESPLANYVKSPQQWYHEVQGLDKHRSGVPFTCACCGRDFPGRMGYRVELRDIYFCKSCARQIFEPAGGRKGPVLIYTPMGNKR